MLKTLVLCGVITLSCSESGHQPLRRFHVSAHLKCGDHTTMANENTVKVFLAVNGNLTDDSFVASWCPTWSGHIDLEAEVTEEDEFDPHLIAYHRCNEAHEQGQECRRTIIKMDKNYTFVKGEDPFFEIDLLNSTDTTIVEGTADEERCQPKDQIYLPRGFGASDNFPVCPPGIHKGNIPLLIED